ncbi:hypothetical protein A3K82_00985 [Candidatus Pacearchaeota archaeon RBG_19FT_COMBO_34_9]|nr:MAG: hypothetical protein A3K82_00985 [Candidatus Pacearchaeota archaeon RBG_19FT_COMBO_34_9]OGJ16532.1 MAG: hypothetical protein A3K74_00285 [Candidatus Pacearchaeota archaeon RBG_13_33_26]
MIAQIPASIQPVYNTFLSCLEDRTLIGIDILESQAGYIELPEFEPGSSYMPFSSQLNFFGNPIPYWYYVSGNNIKKEQVPTEQDIEDDLAEFINERIRECNFDNYYQEGFEMIQGEPKTEVDVREDNVYVKIRMDMQITKGEDTVLVNNHQTTIRSNFGALYNSAKKIYAKEQRELFLENYGIDTLRLYAPVDGVELACSPKTWNADEIFNNLQEAIETNTLALTTSAPSTKDGKYFFVDAGVDEEVRFINSRNWPNSFEVAPSEEALLIANPVGNQQGLGVLGFCYVPYHFVYNVKYPVLVQVFRGDEIFQFPVAVVIQGNKPRQAITSPAKSVTPDLCPYKNTLMTVKTYDTNLNLVDSSLSYECFGTSCEIGKTSSGTLTADFPQCVNGYVIARADGFEETKYLYSIVQEGEINVIMDRLYDLNIQLKLNGANYNGEALIYFVSGENSRTVSYPGNKKVNLSEGQYEISVYIYKDSSIRLDETTHKECVEVPSSGIGGLLGFRDKNCFDVKIPSQIVSNALAGGGKQDYYILENELKNSNTIEINANDFGTPKTITELQNNYLIFEDKGMEVSFK